MVGVGFWFCDDRGGGEGLGGGGDGLGGSGGRL